MSSDFGKAFPADRLPRNYRSILAAIRELPAGTHLTADDVFVRARAGQPKIGFATVHRGLSRLSELGYLSKVSVPGSAAAVYETAAAPHAHFRCTQCGAIQDVEFTIPRDLVAGLAQRHGVRIVAESTTFAGRCANCAGSAAGATEPAR